MLEEVTALHCLNWTVCAHKSLIIIIVVDLVNNNFGR